MNDPGFALRGELSAQRARVIGEFQTTGSVQRLLSQLTRVADRFVRRARPVCRSAVGAAPGARPARVPERQAARAETEARQIRGHAVRARTELQGEPGRAARSADAAVAVAGRGPGSFLE